MQVTPPDIPAIGHNGGPALTARGRGWATHCWRQARGALLPHLPVEVVRLRVRRAFKPSAFDEKRKATRSRPVVALTPA